MKDEFYRFRSIDSLLGSHKELEHQSIYFAEPKSLNDPMEGYRDIYWEGDLVVWSNLFNHYLLCLERVCSLVILSGEEHPVCKDDIPIFSGEDNFPTPSYKKIFHTISDNFFKNTNINKILKSLSERTLPVRKDELLLYLGAIHGLALEIINIEYEKKGFIPVREAHDLEVEQPIVNLLSQNFIGILEETFNKSDKEKELLSVLFTASKSTNDQIELINRFNKVIDDTKKNRNFVIVDFPKDYISQLEKLIFPNWYTACFMSECTNSSVWGHYGNNHSGVCLVFNVDTVDDKENLKLKGVTGYGSKGKIYSFSNYFFHPIDYKAGFGSIDFFRMMGRMPVSKLQSMWYTLHDSVSKCAGEVFSDEDNWRSKYWERFYRDILIKSKDWSYENEYRLILSSISVDSSDPNDRTLNYNFSSLKGIIFGINTKIEHKLEIMRIIEKKCSENKRDDFKFYQARYSSEDKCILHDELSLLKFSKKN
ncbi:DUF2971 domain-containing protein [Psychrobacter fjordensis]|uniref:DUF2971 domain-containing protein n=1 Tax=Psychrobacter fjordensis TaxID=664424 RepID=UPI00191B2C99|nr:DUF2971 domain-containing protein [Psychrobacter fjordensis]